MKDESGKPSRESNCDHALKYTGLFGGVQGLTILISMVRNKLVALLIGPVGMGLVDIYNRTIDLLSNSTNFGISFSAVRNVSLLFEEGNGEKITEFCRVVRTWSLLTAILGTLLCMAASPLISLLAFDSYDYVSVFCLLSPIVGILAVYGGEMAIMKGLRRLKRVAFVTACAAVTTFLTTVPCYWFWGMHGIVPALLLSTGCMLFITFCYSHRVIPWRVSLFSKSEYAQGTGMIKLGVPYILAGILGSGVDWLIRLFFSDGGESLSMVGYFAVGLTLTKQYGQMIFKAMDSDYFPRLSAVGDDVPRMNLIISQQQKVCMLLVAPFLLLFMLIQPIVVPLLYTKEFNVAIPMIICAAPHLFLRALLLPIAYTPLTRNDSRTYLYVELIYDAAYCIMTITAYEYWGLVGAGAALTLSYVVELVLVTFLYRARYGFRFAPDVVRLAMIQGVTIFVGLFVALHKAVWVHYAGGGLLFLFSLWYSYLILKRESTYIPRFMAKFSKWFRR